MIRDPLIKNCYIHKSTFYPIVIFALSEKLTHSDCQFEVVRSSSLKLIWIVFKLIITIKPKLSQYLIRSGDSVY
jgi:hypothetical protein